MGCCDDGTKLSNKNISVPMQRSNLNGEGSVLPQGNHALLALILPKGYPVEIQSDGTLVYTDWQKDEPPGMIQGFQQQEDLISYKPLWDSCAKRELKFVIKPNCECLDMIATCFKHGSDRFLKEVTFEDCCQCVYRSRVKAGYP